MGALKSWSWDTRGTFIPGRVEDFCSVEVAVTGFTIYYGEIYSGFIWVLIAEVGYEFETGRGSAFNGYFIVVVVTVYAG